MKGYRLAGAVALCLLTAALPFASVARAAQNGSAAQLDEGAPLFRLFLKDGSSLVSYGEFARVDDRVVFSMPTDAAADNPQLHLVQISSDRVHWERTVRYADAVRADRYLRTRADADFATLSADIAQALNDIGQTTDPARRLVIVERARKKLADWPPAHYNFKQDDVRQMLVMLDEAIAELRAATGAQHFDLSLVSVAVEPPKQREPPLPPPTQKEIIEQTLTASRVTESAIERVSLLTVASASLERHRSELPTAWVVATKQATSALIAKEMSIDRAYASLSSRTLARAAAHAREAGVRGIQRLLAQIKTDDEALGAARPDAVNALVAAVEAQLAAAQRLRLVRDRWALRLPELRRYRAFVRPSIGRLAELGPALEDIKTLAGSSPDALGSILRGAAQIQKLVATLVPPEEFRELHGLLLSAAQMAETAAATRREAALTGDMKRAWNASSAAAGALMLAARIQSEMLKAFRLPDLPR